LSHSAPIDCAHLGLGRPGVVAARTETRLTSAARRARRRFLSFFPDGFRDAVYVDTERSYKWAAHRAWVQELEGIRALLRTSVHAYGAGRRNRTRSRTSRA
jgi:hypothetical protein